MPTLFRIVTGRKNFEVTRILAVCLYFFSGIVDVLVLYSIGFDWGYQHLGLKKESGSNSSLYQFCEYVLSLAFSGRGQL